MKKILLCFCLLLCITACETKVNSEPSKAVEEYINTKKESIVDMINSFDLGKLNNFIPEETKTNITNAILEFEYEIGDEKIKDDNTATVDVYFITYDLGDLAGSGIKTFLKESILSMGGSTSDLVSSIINEVFGEEFDKVLEKGKTKKTRVVFSLNKINGEWTVDEEKSLESFIDAVSGGLYSTYKNLSETFGEYLK